MFWKITFFSLAMAAGWGVIFPATWQFWNQDAAVGGSWTALACWAGGISSLLVVRKMEIFPSELVRAQGKLFATLPRMIIPIIFLLFSINFYRDPIDRDFLLGIIYSYFVYYPLLLITQTVLFLPGATEDTREEKVREK
ncbi:MAG: hypothetical protein Q4D62_01850 [Planctomycetia bacterium]|nr:hypothetical protein [Planctomycetia bacterium]